MVWFRLSKNDEQLALTFSPCQTNTFFEKKSSFLCATISVSMHVFQVNSLLHFLETCRNIYQKFEYLFKKTFYYNIYSLTKPLVQKSSVQAFAEGFLVYIK